MYTIVNSYLSFEKVNAYSKFKLVIISLLFSFLFSQYSVSQTLAFPEAYGFGSSATGGRGGSVIKVTNLNFSGPGSFKEALDASGPRTIVFEVGGTIDFQGNTIEVDNGDLTIAGQTAPGDGILIKGGGIMFVASNVICRYIRVRPGPSSAGNGDAIGVTAWSGSTVENVIIDHCSASWAGDENVNIRGSGNGIVRNVTVQNTIISECGYGMLCDGDVGRISVYNCLFALNSDRNIRTKGYDGPDFHTEQINNLVYGNQRMTGVGLGCRFTNVGNHYKESSGVNFAGSYIISANNDAEGTASNTHAYIESNIFPENRPQIDMPDLAPYIENSPYMSTNITPDAASSVEGKILSNVGSSFPSRDSVDERIVANWTNGNGTLASSGAYPTILNGDAPDDTDQDGMPDFWEDDNGLDKNDATDRNIVQSDGYTNLEYYLNNIFFLNNGSVNASAGSDQNICEGTSATLIATGGDTYLWSTGETTQSITVTPNSTTTYSVTAFVNSESDTDEVIVNVNAIPFANAGEDQTICSGETITLTANGGTSYLWNTGATSQSINVSPNSTITYSVTVSENNCNDTDDIIVTVNPSPSANAGNDVSILEGENTTLTASGGDTYLWNTGETTQSIIVNPSSNTTYTVIAFMNNCQDEDDVLVTVEPLVNADAGEDVSICENTSTTLIASGGTDYLWSTGETTQSIIVSPNITSTYSVIVSNNASSDTDDVVVTVNPNPVANAGGDITINEGENAVLSATGGNSYIWSTGETTQNITVSPSSTTTYTVITILNGCEDSDDIIVSVDSDEVIANAGADVNICEGDGVTLSASGGTDYLWSTGETTQSISVNPNSTTNYTVIVSNATSSDTDDVTVLVNPLPEVIVSDDVTILQGNYVTLSASGADNYEWSNGATEPNIAVSPSATTTYVVSGYVNNCYDVKDVTVSVVEQVVTNAGEDMVMCAGDSITLTASSSGGQDFLWNTGETTQSIDVSPEEDTIYTVTSFNELDSDSDEILVSVNSCQEEIIPDDENFSFQVYIDSRTSKDVLNIKLSGLSDYCDIYMFDISGKQVYKDNFIANDNQEYIKKINTSKISQGVYIIRIAEGNSIHSKNIVVR